MKDKIDNFFVDVKHILSDDKYVKTDYKENEQRTNVIYLNTDCNLRCSYCYESNSKNGLEDQANCTTKMIDDFLNEICNREKNASASTVVIMGGEPFLKFNLIQYTIYKAMSLIKKGKTKGWGISLITNATLFNKYKLTQLKEMIDLGKKYATKISLELSYDGSGQEERFFPTGLSSREIVESSIQKVIDFKIPFKISYTVHNGNWNNIIEDCIYIFEKWKSEYLRRITIGYAHQILDDHLSSDGWGYETKEYLRPYFKSLFKKYKIPICDVVCDICQKCHKENFIGNSYMSPTTGMTYDEKKTEHEFKQF